MENIVDMSIDKKWMSFMRNTLEFEKGLDEFLDFAFTRVAIRDKILCPCMRCLNSEYQFRNTVKFYIFKHGIDQRYTFWDFHGESSDSSDEDMATWTLLQDMMTAEGFAYANVYEESTTNDPRETSTSVPPTPEEPKPGAQKYYRLVEDAKAKLYPDCKDFSKLSCMVELFHLKCLYGWSNVSFDALLKFSKQLLPEGNTLPESMYEVKKNIQDLGLEYEKIDACINDYILYQGGYDDLDHCPTCGMSRWISCLGGEIDVQAEGKTKIPCKVLCHFPLIPRLQRMFMTKALAKDMRWHKKKHADDGILRHPADSPSWKTLDDYDPSFANDCWNVRLGLASDGFNPFCTLSSPEQGDPTADAPPKQVALAMDRLGRAARLVADVRLGADRLLEALLSTAEPRQANKSLQLILKEEASMRQHLQDLRTLGRQLEESGVLSGSLKSRGNSWGLHMPLVCPDGAVVAYAWKRQLAGQAGASAVDRTRLALKAFTDQKRRFFPHLEDETDGPPSSEEFGARKRLCGSQRLSSSPKEDEVECRTLFDILTKLAKEVPDVRISTYQRLEWLKRASSLALSVNENLIEPPRDQFFPSSDRLRSGSLDLAAVEHAAVIELMVPSVFRAVLSLHPAGSTNPDAVAFFSPDEGGNHVHARGVSSYYVYRHITEHAEKALQYFVSVKSDLALSLLLYWICSYQTLFSEVCRKCRRLLTNDKLLNLLLPPILRPYDQPSTEAPPTQLAPSDKVQKSESATAYHVGCYSDDV